MASATVLSVGSVTVSANGGQTGDLLQQIVNLSLSLTPVTVGAGATSIPAPPSSGGPFELVIEPGYTGSMSIPSGYALVVNGATADNNPLTGGDPTTAIVGGASQPLNYSGGALTVIGVGGSGTVSETSDNAVLSFFGTYAITAGGNNDTVKIDTGSNSTVFATGSHETIELGGGSPSVSAAAAAAAGAAVATTTIDISSTSTSDVVNIGAGASSNLIFAAADTTVNAAGGSSTIVTGQGGHVTLNATGGNELVFDNAGANIINASLSTEYVTAVSVPASTYDAATGGADTIFASSAIDYSNSAGTASSLFFLGGAGAVTVSAAAAETVFGGSGGGSYSIGATSFEFFGAGGSDTVTGGAGSSSILAFGFKNESLTIAQSDSTTSNTIVSFGENDSINASAAAGGNVWQIVNQTLPSAIGGTFTGNSTLVGSTAGGDTFVVYVDASAPPAHTVVISNWQASDALFISNLASTSQSLNATDLAAVNAFEAGGSSSLTLSDGTTIDFSGNKPTTIAHV